jgi:hypothetical protein
VGTLKVSKQAFNGLDSSKLNVQKVEKTMKAQIDNHSLKPQKNAN